MTIRPADQQQLKKIFAMRTLLTILLTFVLSFHIAAQNQLKKFRITINEHSHGGSAQTIITQDSIVSTHYLITSCWMNLKQGMNGYPNMVTKAISNIENEKLANKYYPKREEDAVVDGYIELDFTFEINDKTKKTHIYRGRQEQILEFVKQINEMIPVSFQIPYDEEYLKMFEKNNR
jgi:hypothetical protein